jgi:tetrahydromethanopterin S-methyltransferase subunit G
VEPSRPDEARDDRADRAAQNEAVFRRVNERLEEVNEAFQVATDNAEFVCECARIECAERVQMTLSKYEALRRDPTHFIVKPDHVLPEEERVVERQAQYVVVEKYGRAGQRARQLDPRSD